MERWHIQSQSTFENRRSTIDVRPIVSSLLTGNEKHDVTMVSTEETDEDSTARQKVTDNDTLKGIVDKPKSPTIAKKQPPPEKPEAVWLRTKVILSFWAVTVFVGLPVWWKTTSIYRARLPIQEMLDWSEGVVCIPCSLHTVHC